MSKGNDRPKPRLAPPPAQVAATQQDALDRLEKLKEWTEEPSGSDVAASTQPPVEPVQDAAARRSSAQKPKRPWEIPSPKETHPYHIILSESLFQKIDYVWKRSDERSAKAFVVRALEEAADKALRDMGIEP